MSDFEPIHDRAQTWRDYVPKPMSEACSAFLTDHWQLATFVGFVHLLAMEKDESNKQRAIQIVQTDLETEEKVHLLKELRTRHGAWDALMTTHQMLLEMILCRAVDSYLVYVTSVLALIFKTKPESLRSKEQVTLEEVLKFSDMRDLIDYLAEEKVLKLAYKGMRKLREELKKRPDFDLIKREDTLEHAVRIVETRNLITHNRGVVNKLFLSRLPDFPAKVGDKLQLDLMQVFQDVDFLARSVCDIEMRAAAKFGFPQPISGDEHEKKLQGLSEILKMFDEALLRNERPPA